MQALMYPYLQNEIFYEHARMQGSVCNEVSKSATFGSTGRSEFSSSKR